MTLIFCKKQRLTRHTPICSAVINEANLDDPGTRKKQFIEILQICNGPLQNSFKPSLDGYKLAILQGSPVQIVFVLDLSEFRITKVDDMGYVFVIGGEGVALDWKINLNDRRVQNTFTDSTLPLGDKSPFGILLLNANEKKLPKHVKLTKNHDGTCAPRTIDFDFNVLKLYTLDMLVYGRKVPTNRCIVFEKIMQGNYLANNADQIAYEGEQYL